MAVAGSDSSSTIENNVDAYVSGGSTVTAQEGSVAIDATDTSSITAGGGGLAAARGAGGGLVAGGVAVAAGFAVATNDIAKLGPGLCGRLHRQRHGQQRDPGRDRERDDLRP